MNLLQKTKKELVSEIEALQKQLQQERLMTQEVVFEQEQKQWLFWQTWASQSGLPCLILDNFGFILYANPTFEKILDIPEGQLNYQVFLQNIMYAPNPDDFTTLLYEQNPEGEAQFNTELGFVTAPKKIQYLQFNFVRWSDPHQGQVFWLGAGQDQTESQNIALAFQQSNEVMQDLLDNSNDLIFICKPNGKILFANKVFQKKLGYTPDELENIKVHQLFDPSEKIHSYRNILKLLKGENIPEFQTVLIDRDHKKVHLEGKVNFRKENEELIAIRGIFNDISEKIRAEKAQFLYYSIANLILKSKDLNQLYQSIHQELQKVIDAKNFYIKLFAPDKKTVLFPYYRDEYDLNMDFKVNRSQITNGLSEYVMKSGKAVFFYEEDIKYLMEKENVQLFSLIPKVWLGVPLRFDNEVIGLISVKSYDNRSTYDRNDLELLDFVSGQIALAIQRKKSEEKINEQAARLQAIFESSSHLMWSLNRKMQLSSFNQNYVKSIEERYGVTPGIDMPLNQLRSKLKEDEKFYLWDERYREAFKGKLQYFEVSYTLDGGELQWQEVYLNPIYLNGSIEEVSAIAHDITAKKMAETELLNAKDLALRSLQVKQSFLANMSHEIRTPMNGVIGMIDLMRNTKLNVKQKEYMHTIKRSSEALLHILNDILDLSKIEAGKMELQLKTTDVHLLLEKILTLFQQQATIRHNTFAYHIDSKVPRFILADEIRLLQIISNLTANAIKFTENGHISINLYLEKEKRGQLYFKIEVKDTGIGISEENIKLLFNSFSQVDNSLSKQYSGTGLGLAISRELTKLMHGDIGVESKKNEGSTFWFTFQAEKISLESQDTPLEIIEDTSFDIIFSDPPPFILVVDDNLINQKVASEILQKVGCKVMIAQSGKEAIQKVIEQDQKKQMFDLIFMDIQMPDMDGIQTTVQIKALNIAHLPPLIAMTAYSMEEDRQKFLAQGLDDYISKPITAHSLIEKVKQYSSSEKKDQSKETELIIDEKIISQLKKYGGWEFVESTFEDFIIDTQYLIQTCQKALKSKDDQSLHAAMHTLKGNSGTMGITNLYLLCLELENNFQNINYTKAKNDLKKLEKYFKNLKSNYKNTLNKLNHGNN